METTAEFLEDAARYVALPDRDLDRQIDQLVNDTLAARGALAGLERELRAARRVRYRRFLRPAVPQSCLAQLVSVGAFLPDFERDNF